MKEYSIILTEKDLEKILCLTYAARQSFTAVDKERQDELIESIKQLEDKIKNTLIINN